MKISTKGRYALRLMLDLALNNTGEAVSLKDIARRQDISDKYLEQIISILNKAGYVRSIRGAQGGYMLRRPPKDTIHPSSYHHHKLYGFMVSEFRYSCFS